jgi:hypothetical protein
MELADILQPGDAVVSKDAGAATMLIRYFTDSTFTHVDGYIGSILGVPMLVGAGPVFAGIFSKVRVVPLSTIQNDFVVMRPRYETPVDRADIAKFMLSQVNKAYAYKQYIAIGYRIVLRFLNKRLGTKFNVPTKDTCPGEWICSELYAAACNNMLEQKNAVGNFFGDSPMNIYPGDIAADTIRMELVAERINGEVHILA